MYTILLQTHRIIVTLFLLHYVVKFVFLFLSKDELLTKYSKTTKIPEMILSLGFLITGGWMLIQGAVFGNLMIIKLICVFTSIPLAVIGFKKKNKMLAALSILLIFLAYGLAEMNKKAKTGQKIDTSTINDPIAAGKLIYRNTCMKCHGEIGNGGVSGAKDLSLSKLSMDEQKVAY